MLQALARVARRLSGETYTLPPAEEKQNPIETRPVCPYEEGWPLARAWWGGVEDALRDGRCRGSSPARVEGFRAGKRYIRSGQALADQIAKITRLKKENEICGRGQDDFIERMSRAAAQYRLAMHGTTVVHDGIRAIAIRMAHDALETEDIVGNAGKLRTEVLLKLGEYDHRFDRQNEQFALIEKAWDHIWHNRRL